MLPLFNYSIDNETKLWHQGTLLRNLGYKKSPASIKKIERAIVKASYLPAVVQPEDVLDTNEMPLQQNLLQHDISAIQSRRGK